MDETSKFPSAQAPEIIRAHQKDAYVESVLKDNLEDVVRRIKGSRFLHVYHNEISTASNLVYLGLTTLVGIRTLGEEYCDIFNLKSDSKLPSFRRRAGYVLSNALGSVVLHKVVSVIKKKLKSRLLSFGDDAQDFKTILLRTLKEILDLTSIQTIITLHLAWFYFFGSYYQISRRLWKMKYVFGHRVNPLDSRGGYELLGSLILFQLLYKGWSSLKKAREEDAENNNQKEKAPGVQPVVIDLEDPTVLPFIPESSRKCTLCLSYMKNPSSTICGHLFCWTCVSEWCREKPECPLCRQTCLEQNLLPLK